MLTKSIGGIKRRDFLFTENKVPVMNSLAELHNFITKYSKYYFCLYLAYKEAESWEKSTSRTYMNKLYPQLIYLPVNIAKDDYEFLKQVYEIAKENKQIIAINQTQPHKSNPVLISAFKNPPSNIDAVIKNSRSKLIPHSLNGVAFASWFKDEVASFKNKTIILLGVGGAGEPIAREISKHKPKKIYLIDKIPKHGLAQELGNNSKYYPSISDINIPEEQKENIVFIFTTGKEFHEGFKDADIFINTYANKNNIFVDLQPHLDLETVNYANRLGWQGYTGYGMNARNDYALLLLITKQMNIKPVSFRKFQEIVAANS